MQNNLKFSEKKVLLEKKEAAVEFSSDLSSGLFFSALNPIVPFFFRHFKNDAKHFFFL